MEASVHTNFGPYYDPPQIEVEPTEVVLPHAILESGTAKEGALFRSEAVLHVIVALVFACVVIAGLI